jgi:hypothetical protein
VGPRQEEQPLAEQVGDRSGGLVGSGGPVRICAGLVRLSGVRLVLTGGGTVGLDHPASLTNPAKGAPGVAFS